MHAPEIIVTNEADDESIQIIGNGLNHFNDQHVGYGDRQPLAVLVRDPQSGDVVGGASGRTSLGLLFLDLFHLPETLRGMGIGTEVLRRFEDEPPPRLPLGGGLYDQLSGAAVLRTQRLGTVWRGTLRSAWYEPDLPQQDAVS